MLGALCVFGVSEAAADPGEVDLVPRLTVGAAYVDNPFFDPLDDPTFDLGVPATAGDSARFDLRGGLGAEWRLTGRDSLVADVDASYSQYTGEAATGAWEAAFDLAGYHRFGEGLYLGVGVRGVLAHVDVFDTEDLRWGEGRVAGRMVLDRWTLDAMVGVGSRSFPDRPFYLDDGSEGTPGQSDLTARARVDARWAPAALSARFGGGIGYDVVSAQRGGVDYGTALVDAWVSQPFGDARASLSLAGWRRSFEVDPARVDLAGAVGLYGGYRLWPTVELGARYRYIRSGSDAELGRYAQHFAGVELVAWWAPPPAVAPRIETHGPASTGEGWRFSHRAPEARQVSLVGDFNGWAAERHPLRGPDAEGWWTVTLPLEPGRYTYMFVEDGDRFVRPTAAAGYVDDGFGGEVGVLFVWQGGKKTSKTSEAKQTKYRQPDENR